MVGIVKSEIHHSEVILTLSDGKTIHLAPHDDHLHVHFSGLDDYQLASQQIAANNVNIHYVPMEETKTP